MFSGGDCLDGASISESALEGDEVCTIIVTDADVDDDNNQLT